MDFRMFDAGRGLSKDTDTNDTSSSSNERSARPRVNMTVCGWLAPCWTRGRRERRMRARVDRPADSYNLKDSSRAESVGDDVDM